MRSLTFSVFFVAIIMIFGYTTATAYDLSSIDGLYTAIQQWHYDTTGIELPKLMAYGIADTIISASDRFDVPTDVIAGIMAVESSFIPTANNGISYGLMQVQPETASFIISHYHLKDMTVSNVYGNIMIGTGYIKYLYSIGMPREKVIKYYNAGSNMNGYYKLVTRAIRQMAAWH